MQSRRCLSEICGSEQLLQQDVVNAAEIHALLELFEELNAVLRIYTDVEPELLDEDIERLIQDRVEARKSKNWARADEIRDELSAQGILLEDTAQGMRWRRK